MTELTTGRDLLAFKTIAVVNRGEAAVRFLRALKDYNLERGTELRSVALYTDPDRLTPFVRLADHAVALGPALTHGADGVVSTYTDHAKVLDAIARAGADAVWPGWGFVAEDAAFVEALEARGITFIGPPSAAMRRLGDKIAAKELAITAGVPLAPWHRIEDHEAPEITRAAATRIGFPLVVKAAAGGGGRGIRMVRDPAELMAAIASVRDEVRRSFRAGGLFLETCVTSARHIEVQLVVGADGRGATLGLRDCTVQRRHQKVIEEAPSPVVAGAMAERLEAAAVRLGELSGYRGVGTVEFLVDIRRDLAHFLEVNTRLQVEHTVTESVTGVDLVHTMIDIARGLPWAGAMPGVAAPVARGHAIEVRLNAEDPERGFQPAPGRVRLFRAPLGPGIRIDSGIAEGVSIAPEFDSMVAKLIAIGANRPQALARLRRALRELEIVVEDGTTNKSFLLELLDDPAVVNSTADTGWLDRRQAEARTQEHAGTFEALCAAAVLVRSRQVDRSVGTFMRDVQSGIPYPLALGAGAPIDLSLRGVAWTFEAFALGDNRWLAGPTGESMVELTLEPTGTGSMSLVIGNRRMMLLESFGQSGLTLEIDGMSHRIELASGGRVTSPMPALVVKVHVAEGQLVEVGERLVTLEAMKMEVPVVARQKGVVGAINCRAQEQVAVGHVLLTLEEDGGTKSRDTRQTGQRLAFAMPNLKGLARAELLGFEISATHRKALLRSLETPDVAAAFGEAWTLPALAELITLFGEIEQVFGATVAMGDPAAGPVRGEAAFYARCRALASDRPAEPAPELEQRIQQALRHFATTSQSETLWRMACAHADQGGARHRLVNALLRRLITLEGMSATELGDDRELELALARTAEIARPEWPSVRDNARQARYLLFRRRRLAGPGQTLAQVLTPSDERPFDMAQLVRAVYGAEAEVRPEPPALGATLRSIIAEGGVRVLALATSAELGARAIETLLPRIESFLKDSRSEIHVFVIGASDDGDRLAGLVTAIPRHTNLNRVALTWSPDGIVERHRSFTINGKATEESWLRDVHPERARRLELWRLSGFEASPLACDPAVLAFRLRAQDNPKDERIIVFAELTRAPGSTRGPSEDPARRELEWVFGESLRVIREAQAVRRSSERYFMNRIVVHVAEGMDITSDELMQLARRLEGATRGLGLQKVVVLCRLLRDGVVSRRVLTFAVRGRHRLEIHEEVPSCAPIRPATAYHLKVEAARRLGVVYPYEIIRALRGSDRGGQALLPHPDMADGRFVELDLADDGETLVRVDRLPGENTSGVVVGLVTHRTVKFPDGMTRVWLGSDPTRSMGALAEPECRRVVSAIKLAAKMGVPIEWLPVSSGARISMDSGTENLDWTARVLRAIIEHGERGGVIHVIVAGVNVGAQSYWNAEATMLMHTRGVLIMTSDGAMVLTGKKALEVSGSVAAEDERGIGGVERIMGPNGQAQYSARTIGEAYQILFRHYALTYVAPGEHAPRRAALWIDPTDRSVLTAPATDGGFTTVGEIFSDETNPGKKRPFAIRDIMRAVVDTDLEPLERFGAWEGGETAAVWEAQLGGFAVCVIGFESRTVMRRDHAPLDGPDRWSGGTLYPQSSRKVARALNQASGQRPVVVLANLSGFDGSPESMRKWQLEYGAEIGRAVVAFEGPILFVVVGRYHGGAYVVFSKALNASLVSLAVEGAFASVIGGGPAAAVVFPREVRRRTEADARIIAAREALATARGDARGAANERLERTLADVTLEHQGLLAREFDTIHDVARAVRVGSLDGTITAERLRPELIGWLERLDAQRPDGDAPEDGNDDADDEAS